MTSLIPVPAESNATIVKADTRGRALMPAERRDKLLDEFEQSGVSAAKFAALAGLKYSTFAAWAARRRKQRAATSVPTPNPGPVHWLEAVVGENPSAAGSAHGLLKLHLPSGVWLELADLKQVPLAVALLQALQPRPRPC